MDPSRWYPIAASDDLPLRHVYQGKLMGREVAIWRADDGYVNIWENRCLHRGLRLTVGVNDGVELRCQYHGWRYASRTAACTYIPAHPADAPARTICNNTFPAVECHGLVWTSLEADGGFPALPALDIGSPLALRGVEIRAPIDLVRARLRESLSEPEQTFDLGPAADAVPVRLDGADDPPAVMFLQPVDADRTDVRGVVPEAPPESQQLGVLRRYNSALCRLRDGIEAEAAELPAPTPISFELPPVPEELSVMPEAHGGRSAPLRVQVARRWQAGEEVVGFELRALEGQLPSFQPGAHIDVHLPNGLVRQYSLVNGPGDLDHYRIGVKLEPDSRGGSRCLHESVREGDVLATSEPRNNFQLRRDATRTVLLAGGIGITPLLAMAQVLVRSNLQVELHCFARSARHVAFPDLVDRLGPVVVRHLGLTPGQTAAAVTDILDGYDFAHHVYICGPGPMLDAARRIAADAGWPDEAVHFEYFQNPTELDRSTAFEVSLARSALTVQVPPGQSLLDVLRQNGVVVPSSCEQGACGTCAVGVLEGRPDHQDVYLNDSERRRNDRIMTCVSRSLTDRLVLDI